MSVVMLNSFRHGNLAAKSLEDCIRTALDQGELSPELKHQISNHVLIGNLSQHDQALLRILEDAIQDGCIRVNHL
ncbi:MAG: hypothetical protein MUF49_31600 [Oculatellaceae cyanobacterium Prado106]|nr:hypothetical protein [Oculatellaceae cyanobacterium Prado106]